MVQFGGTRSEKDDRILIIGATNRPDELDEAVRRRLEKRLYIPLPDREGRSAFIKAMIKNQSQDIKIELSEEDIEKIVTLTKGYSGADLESLCTEASLIPLRQIEDIANISMDSIRGIRLEDFE